MRKERLSARFVLLILAFSTMYSDQSAGGQNIRTDTAQRIVSAKLVSPGVGWAAIMRDAMCAPGNVFPPCPPMRLYWTDDNGQHWRNITPPDMPTRNIRQVFFLDRLHGWVLSTDALSEETNAPFYLFSTEDAGKTWRTLVLRRPMFDLMDDYTFPTELFFADSQHGWILWGWGIMNSRQSFLLSTADGGRTWSRLPDPPYAASLQFTTPRDGWMIGESQHDRGIPMVNNDAIWTTRDGGQHWQEISLPQLAGMKNEAITIDDMKFKNRREGAIVEGNQFSGDEQFTLVWVTHDSGRTWEFSKLQGTAEHTSILGAQVVRLLRDPTTDEVTIRTSNRTITPDISYGLPSHVWFVSLDFIDHVNAWLNVYSALLATTDGGKSFHPILPSPDRSGSTRF